MDAPAASKPGLLIVDDDELILDLLVEELESDFDVIGARTRSEASLALEQLGPAPACALIDLGLPPHPDSPREGLALVRELVATRPDCVVVVVSGQNEENNGKVARTLGAIDYIAKPCSPEQIRTALERARLAQRSSASQDGLLGGSAAITRLQRQIRQFGGAAFPVLIEGESGTGKELVARGLHRQSGRSGELIAINCAAMPEQLFEASLFGARRGAYTGAATDTQGHLAAAAAGTLLLDEIGDLPLAMQPKLLRMLESSEYFRVGDAKPRHADVRILAATNRPLHDALRAGQFREDLYHRLSVLAISTPALRDMGDDRLALLDHFRTAAARSTGTEPFEFDGQALAVWNSYGFPGNVRELRNVAARLQVLYPAQSVGAAELGSQLLPPLLEQSEQTSLDDLLSADARAHAQSAYATCRDHAQAAKRLGITVKRLRELLEA